MHLAADELELRRCASACRAAGPPRSRSGSRCRCRAPARPVRRRALDLAPSPATARPSRRSANNRRRKSRPARRSDRRFLEFAVAVPDHLSAAVPVTQLDRLRHVAFAIGAGEDKTAASSRHQPTSSIEKFSITVLASSLRHISTRRLGLGLVGLGELELDDTCPGARRRPRENPRDLGNGRSPCPGVEHAVLQRDMDSGFHRRLFTAALLLERRWPADVAGALVDQDAQPARDLLIGLLDLAEIAAEAILVELLVGPDVPQPAASRG